MIIIIKVIIATVATLSSRAADRFRNGAHCILLIIIY